MWIAYIEQLVRKNKKGQSSHKKWVMIDDCFTILTIFVTKIVHNKLFIQFTYCDAVLFWKTTCWNRTHFQFKVFGNRYNLFFIFIGVTVGTAQESKEIRFSYGNYWQRRWWAYKFNDSIDSLYQVVTMQWVTSRNFPFLKVWWNSLNLGGTIAIYLPLMSFLSSFQWHPLCHGSGRMYVLYNFWNIFQMRYGGPKLSLIRWFQKTIPFLAINSGWAAIFTKISLPFGIKLEILALNPTQNFPESKKWWVILKLIPQPSKAYFPVGGGQHVCLQDYFLF